MGGEKGEGRGGSASCAGALLKRQEAYSIKEQRTIKEQRSDKRHRALRSKGATKRHIALRSKRHIALTQTTRGIEH